MTAPVSWFEKVRAYLASPAFGVAAAAVVLLGVAMPSLSGLFSREGIRGVELAPPADAVRIQLVGSNPAILAALKATGSFDESAISSVTSLSAADILGGPKVIVDFSTSSITVVDREGEIVHRDALPAEPSKLADAIFDAVSRL